MPAYATANPFVLFSTPHTVAISATIAVPVLLSFVVRKSNRPLLRSGICWLLAAVLVGNELTHTIFNFRIQEWGLFLRESLPLHICDVAVYLTAFSLVRRRQLTYELVLFLGLAGTLQGIITPDILEGFPSYIFITFFVKHCGIVAGVLLLTWGYRMRPRLRGVFLTYLLANGYTLLVVLADWLIEGANYMFLCRPPEGDSPFFFAPWPWYILVLQPIALAMFLMVYAPFGIMNRLRARKARTKQS